MKVSPDAARLDAARERLQRAYNELSVSRGTIQPLFCRRGPDGRRLVATDVAGVRQRLADLAVQIRELDAIAAHGGAFSDAHERRIVDLITESIVLS
jgi:hypothetical protein